MQCHHLGVAPSTCWTYQSGLTAFNTFCHQFRIIPFPASLLTLEYFCAHASQQIFYKTLKVHLSGIHLAHIERGLPDPTKSTSLHLVCRGIRRQQGHSRRVRLPITINFSALVKRTITDLCPLYPNRATHDMFTQAFYGFFRASKLLSNLSHFVSQPNVVNSAPVQNRSFPMWSNHTYICYWVIYMPHKSNDHLP